jgi:hypothetical protein
MSSTSMTSGNVLREPMTEDGYLRLAKLASTDLLAATLMRLHGAAAPAQAEEMRYARTDQELAHSFLRLHANHQPAPIANDPKQKGAATKKTSDKTKRRRG